MARVRLLARQSLTRADSVSVDAQIAGMTDAFTAQGHTIVGVPLTAQNTRGWREIADRADLTEALASADRGDYDILGVWSIDRLARSVRILETVVHELAKHRVSILSKSEEWAADPFLRQIMGAMAERFTRDLSARLTSVWPQLHAAGKAHGIAPFGFGKADGKLVVDPDEAPTMRRMCDAILSGAGVREIVAHLTVDGIHPRRADTWDEDIVRVMLRNPALAGGVRLNGVIVWDAHDGMITRAEWDAIQRRLGQPTAPRAHKLASSWLDGLVWHGCGARSYVTLYRPGGRPVRMIVCRTAHEARRCSLQPRGCSARKVEVAARQALATDFAAAVPVAVALRRGQALAGGDVAERRRAKLASDRARIEERRQRAEGLYLDGRRDAAWFRAEEADAVAALAGIATADASLPAVPDADAYGAVAAVVDRYGAAIADASDDAIRGVLAVAGVVIVDGLDLTVQYHEDWNRLLPVPCRVRWR